MKMEIEELFRVRRCHSCDIGGVHSRRDLNNLLCSPSLSIGHQMEVKPSWI